MQIVSSFSEADSIDPDVASQRPLRSDIERSSALDLDADPDALCDDVQGDDVEIASRSKCVDLMNDDDDDVDCNGNEASSECEEERAWYHSPRNWLKLNVLFFVVALMVAALSQPELLWYGVEALLQWMERHLVIGSMVFMSLYIVCELLMFPCLLLLFGAGFVFCNVLHSMIRGLFVSTMIVFTAELVASTTAFLMARYLMRSNIKKMAAKYPKFQVIDAAVKRHGFRVTLLFRMSPLTPYNLFNCMLYVAPSIVTLIQNETKYLLQKISSDLKLKHFKCLETERVWRISVDFGQILQDFEDFEDFTRF